MTTTAVRPPVCSMELGGSGLAGARHLRDEREKRRRARRTRQTFGTGEGARVAASASSASPSLGFGYADGAAAAAAGGGGGPSPRAPRVSPRQRRRVEDTHAYLCAKVDPVMGGLILALVEGRPKNVRQAALDHLLSKKGGGGDRTGMTAGGTATAAGENDPTRDRLSSQQDDRETSRRKKEDSNSSHKTHDNGGGVSSSPAAVVARRLAERQDRLFMAREIGPLVTELITRTLRAMPTEVEDFLVEQLQGIASSVAHRENDGNDGRGLLRPDIRKSRPSGISSREESRKDRPNADDESEPQRSTRPSTARSRLEEARNLDLQAQETLLPRTERADSGACTSPGVSNGPKGVSLSDGENCSVNGDDGAPLLLSEREKVVAVGVKESLNKPWDMEVRRVRVRVLENVVDTAVGRGGGARTSTYE